MSKPGDLLQGTLDLLILRLVSAEPLHGLAISQRLRTMSKDALQVSYGSLYPALHKLEHNGLLRAEWKEAAKGRRAKYYTITRAGAKRLARETAEWDRLSSAVSMILRPAEVSS